MMNEICGIYKITSPSGKIYIGKSINIKRRKYSYRSKKGLGQPRLCNSILKYGWENHEFEIIYECDEVELNDLEKYFIKLYNTCNTFHGMNLTEGGTINNMLNETKNKISEKLKGIKRSDATRHKISIGRKGKYLGISPSEGTKEKISTALKGIKRSAKTIEKMKQCKTGLIHTEKTKQKISDTKCGRYEIYDQNNRLIHRFHSNIKKKLKELKLPEHTFCDTYKFNTKIKNGNYKNWYVVRYY